MKMWPDPHLFAVGAVDHLAFHRDDVYPEIKLFRDRLPTVNERCL